MFYTFLVLNAIHVTITAKMYDIAIAAISCKITPTTSLSKIEKFEHMNIGQPYEYYSVFSALHTALFLNEEEISLDLIHTILTHYPEDLHAKSDTGKTCTLSGISLIIRKIKTITL